MRLPARILALLLTFACAITAHADIIFGNLAGYNNNDAGTPSGIAGETGSVGGVYSNKGIGFTMSATAYTVTSLTLRLTNFDTVGANDRPSISIWTNNGSNAPGTQVGTFTNPGSFNGATTTNYVFTPASSITLSASTSYFIVVQQLTPYSSGVDNAFTWLNGSPTITPTGIASTAIARFGTTANPTGMTSSSSNFNLFQLDGTVVSAVPEPSTYAALAGLAALGLAACRRRRH